MPLSATNFGSYLGAWGQMFANQFKLYYPLRGGWEAWVQASVAAFIINDNSTVDILREQMIFYGSQQKVDWLLNDSDERVTRKIAIELKCQSFENQKRFTSGLDGDIAKLAQANLKEDYRGCKTVVVGVSFTQDAADWMRDNHFNNRLKTGDIAIGMLTLN